MRPTTLSHSHDAEKGMLSCMMQDQRAIATAVQRVKADRIFNPLYQSIYDELVKLWEQGKKPDVIAFTEHLRDLKLLDKIGGVGELMAIYSFSLSTAALDYYIDIIEEHYRSRKVVAVCTEALRKASSTPTEELIGQIVTDLTGAIANRAERQTLKEAVMEKLERMETGAQDSSTLKTGIALLDHHSPLRAGDMPLLTGERKSGKSILSLTIATNIAKQGHRVLYFSLEDRIAKVTDRLFAGVSRIPMDRHSIKSLNDGDYSKATKAIEDLCGYKIDIIDDVFDLPSILAIVRQKFAVHPDLRLVVLDYAQLVLPSTKKETNREQEVALVSRSLRLLAMETGLPIILLSQLNEQGRSRESRALEQDATANWNIKIDKLEFDQRNIDIPWQRNGESGVSFEVAFLGKIARIENLEHGPKT